MQSPLARVRLPRTVTWLRDVIKDGVAGLLASVVLVANIVSFAALMFGGDLHAGIPIAIWSMLIGSSVGGAWIALSTSLPPISTGIDSPTGAVLVLLGATAGAAVLRSGGDARGAIATIMLLFTAATALTGVVLYGLGALRWGSYLRFVPYFVVGGFLAATGWLLIAGGLRMTLGARTLAAMPSAASAARLAIAVATFAALLALRRWSKSPFAMPVTLVAIWVLLSAALSTLASPDVARAWYLPSLGALASWSPNDAVRSVDVDWRTFARLVPELAAVTIVALISLVTKVASLEVARQVSGDLDRELRAHGVAALAAAPLGGMVASLQIGTSRLLEHAGGATRLSGLACAVVLGVIGIVQIDLPRLIPIPIVAGLLFFLAYNFLLEGLWRSYLQRAWVDLALAVAIMLACVRYGYLVGVLAGLLAACVLFAISYARLGVVRRHVTRAQFAGNVYRSAEASEFLRASGDAIQLYSLSGYIFFGSSEGLFERVRGDVERAQRHVDYVILDFEMVSGADASAIASFVKLRNFCNRHRTTIVYCALSASIRKALALGGLVGGKSRHKAFDDVNVALAWCEDLLLEAADLAASGHESFEAWVQRQLGDGVPAGDLIAYLDRKEVAGAQVLYRQGDAADTVDLVAAGNLAIDIATSAGNSLRVRRIATHSVVGEMGFFRRSTRSATVSSEGPATIYTLTRERFDRMRAERPDVASAFDDFIVRVLADRTESANRAVSALIASGSR